MPDTPPQRIALLDRLRAGEGFAGSATGGLVGEALRQAGFEVLEASSLLSDRGQGDATPPDAWITLSGGAACEDVVQFCQTRSLRHLLVDPTLAGAKEGFDRQDIGTTGSFTLTPFLDPAACLAAQRDRAILRQTLSQRHGLPADEPWIFLTVPEGSVTNALFSTFEILSRLFMLDWSLAVSTAEEHREPVTALLPSLSGKSKHLIRGNDAAERIAFMAASDLCLSVERSGGVVIDLLEALASGLAIVANKSPESEQIVENGITGRLSASGNPASLANDLTFLLRHENFLQSYRENTRAQVAERHDILIAARTLRQVLAPDPD